MSETAPEAPEAPAPGNSSVEGQSGPAQPDPTPAGTTSAEPTPEGSSTPEPAPAPEPTSDAPPQGDVSSHKVKLIDAITAVEGFFMRHPELERGLMTELRSGIVALERFV